MTSVNDTAKTVKTKHKGVYASLMSYWDSYGKHGEGETQIFFMLHDLNHNNFRVEKSYNPQQEDYKSGNFSDSDVKEDFGQLFTKWLSEVNRRKYINLIPKHRKHKK